MVECEAWPVLEGEGRVTVEALVAAIVAAKDAAGRCAERHRLLIEYVRGIIAL